ncbi:MAG: Asparagine synthetase [Pelotomaculum thermopropionicum]|uniref:asparagine synthase (glutamine-hydrolyzing) n=1 Tax=Pelotomaculum thermopropionicum TaxID=110500 RepID=A0A117M3N1_9FIRM|nr:MAG: Asparagine synthetase [Pelotomaculum thermopropionicum]
MCGITGWIDWETDLTQSRAILEAMVGSLAHRGPDASGLWLSSRAALGHRRLVVIDPEGGRQPMTRRCGEFKYTIIYNGELYNTLELRQELEMRGHTFFSRHSDTEVLLVSYMEWGASCLDRLNGIYAFAVWSEAEQSLFLARDRLGVKPLFYAIKGTSFIFGSELKALLAHPKIRPEVNTEGLAEIFVMGPSRTPGHGIYRGVAELKPGHCLLYNRESIRLRRYWNMESRPHTDDFNTTVDKVREFFLDTVKRQLASDVPVCTLLSGGLDSSAITAVVAGAFRQNRQGTLRTYSVNYQDNNHYFQPDQFQPSSDAPWVQRVSNFFGTSHRVIEIDNDKLVEALTPAVLANDLPGMADIDASLLLFCREIKKDATVALSGESADEVFGGYPWFHNPQDIAGATFPWIRVVRERAKLLSPELAARIRPENYVTEQYREALAEVPRLAGEAPLDARMREMFYLNLTRFMQMLLDRKDRMSMAAGLEVRVPFCDHRLVDYVWNIPWTMKKCDHMAKGILRRALSGVLPEDVLKRRKSPYPKIHNPAYLDAVCKWVLRILDDKKSPILPLINVQAVRDAALTKNRLFDRPWFSQLMGDAQWFAYLIQVDTWLRHYRVQVRL